MCASRGPRRPVDDHEGIQLRAVLDQRAEEIRERAAKAEPRAAELRKRIEEQGEQATAAEVAAARERLIRVVWELRERYGLIAYARPDTGEPAGS